MLGRVKEIKIYLCCLIYRARITNSRHSLHLAFLENDKEIGIHNHLAPAENVEVRTNIKHY